MAEWSRETSWRQGSILPQDFLQSLGLKVNYENMVAMVVTHDCDIAQLPNNEPNIEIIVGRYVEQLDGAFTNTKSPRKLHIELHTPEGIKSAEFAAVDKFSIEKMTFIGIEPNQTIYIDPSALNVFRRWLGIRYTRFAFPDAFEGRLKANDLDKKIAKALKKHGAAITAIFFDVDDGIEQLRTDPNDTYVLDITILYATDQDPNAAEVASETAKTEITKAFENKLYDKTTHTWVDIELRYCDVVSDEALTYKQSVTLKQWRMEHISFAEDPPHPVPVMD
jgi:hypothetical protein